MIRPALHTHARAPIAHILRTAVVIQTGCKIQQLIGLGCLMHIRFLHTDRDGCMSGQIDNNNELTNKFSLSLSLSLASVSWLLLLLLLLLFPVRVPFQSLPTAACFVPFVVAVRAACAWRLVSPLRSLHQSRVPGRPFRARPTTAD